MDLSDIKSRRTLLEREREEMGIAAGKLIADVKLKHLDKLKSCLPKKSESDADLGGANVARVIYEGSWLRGPGVM